MESIANSSRTDSGGTSRTEWLWAGAVAIAAVALTLLPYALGYAFARPGLESTGVIMNPEDAQSYFAKMLQGYDGQWLYRIPFTSEDHAPAFVGGFYLLLGHLARLLGLSLVAIWHLARTLAALAMFLATFGFITRFLPETRTRWVAYLLAVFGSGLGWLLFILDQPYWLDWFPVDFKMPEAHLLFSALTFPHVALGTALILTSFGLALSAIAGRRRWTYAVGAGFANLALAIVYPFLIYLVAVVLSVYWILLVVQARRLLYREAMSVVITLAMPVPLVLYYALTLSANPVFRAWDAQAVTLSPPVPHYLIAYGVLLLLALLTLRHRQTEQIFLWAWLLGVAVLVYAPINPQRRFVQGVHIPLAMLAAVGWCQVVLPWLAQTRAFRWIISHPRYSLAGLERLLTSIFLLTMSLSNLYVWASVTLTAAVEQPYPLFRASDEIAAVDWLRANTARAEVVLSAYETGNYIAARAGNRVVIGHWAETIDWEIKFAQVDQFYSVAAADAWRRDWLARYRVALVWVGAQERALGAVDFTRASYLEPIFSNTDATIYRVRR